MNTSEKGFTLVELLIALALSFVVILAVVSVFNYSNQSYIVQEDIAAMQQDIRVSRAFIERDARMAGAGLEDYPPVVDPENLRPFTFLNAEGFENSDELTVRYIIPIADECGEDPSETDDISISCSSLADLTINDDMPESSATFNVNQDLSAEPYSNWADGCYCGGETYEHPSYGFEFIISTPAGFEPRRAETAYLTQVMPNQNNKMQNRPIRIDGVRIENKIVNSFPENSRISFFTLQPINAYRYFIDDGYLLRRQDLTDPDNPGAPQTIAENIEDLQFAFGLDTNDDGEVDYWVDGSDPNDLTADGDLLDEDVPDIRAVRINVLGRTNRAHQELGATTRPAIEDHAAATDSDFFRRRLSQVTVQLRNVDLLLDE